MSKNAVAISSLAHVPLSGDMYQRIHASALRLATQGYYPQSVPEHIDLERLKQLSLRFGPDSYLVHPADIIAIFDGVTSAVYHMIETRYCSRLGRSIKTTWRILNAMAQHTQMPLLSYEAVWAICLYLEASRRASVDVSIERDQSCWWVGKVVPDLRLRQRGSVWESPSIFFVIDTQHSHALSFSFAFQALEEEWSALVLYEALVSQRRPHQKAISGLAWHLPQRVVSEVSLSKECRAVCTRLGIQVETAHRTLPLLQTIYENWAGSLAGSLLEENRCAILLDTYLYKMHGHGPIREQQEDQQRYADRVGYNRDPAEQFPLLRSLLPLHSGRIDREGSIIYDGLHYRDEVLLYWPNHLVTMRQSSYSKAKLWVYLDGEILCQAMAQEWRRFDGSYRR